MPWVCLQFVIEVFPDHTHILFLRLWSNFISLFRDMSISGTFVAESCSLSGMVPKGRPPAFVI